MEKTRLCVELLEDRLVLSFQWGVGRPPLVPVGPPVALEHVASPEAIIQLSDVLISTHPPGPSPGGAATALVSPSGPPALVPPGLTVAAAHVPPGSEAGVLVALLLPLEHPPGQGGGAAAVAAMGTGPF